jgi:tetratricopeptide (TPR) repeat protein
MTGRRLWVLAAAALLLGACATGPRPERPLRPEGLALRSAIGAVPFYPQEEYQCGPAALAMALSWSGVEVRPEELAPMVFTPARRGSLQPDMIAAARRLGRLAYTIAGEEALLREIAAGHPVVVLQNLGLSWYPVWHYAVAVGYDLEAGEITLHSGLSARKRTALSLFRATWSRGAEWGLLVLPPDRLPATAEETRLLESLTALEGARRPEAAAAGYRAALERWPGSLTAMMGLGNSLYAVGDLEGSAQAFRRAAENHPESGAAFNNLAHVLGQLGRRNEALAAALRAVALGGPLKETYEKTLLEIRSSSSP